MKSINTMLTRVLILASLILPCSGAGALETYERSGIISKLGYNSFTTRDQTYRLDPAVKIQVGGLEKASLGDLKVGDRVWFEGKNQGGRYVVVTIIYMPPPPFKE